MIKIEVVYEMNGGEEVGLFAEGHHEAAAFADAVAEWRKGDGHWLDPGYIPEVPLDEVRHETWRNEEGGEGYFFRPAQPGEPGAYPVTCFAFEGGTLASPADGKDREP